MVVRLEMAGLRAEEADDQEDRPDQDVEAVEAGRHEEGAGIDAAGEGEGGVAVFVDLDAGEEDAERDGQRQPLEELVAAAFPERVMRPGDGHPGHQQDQGVEEREVPGVEGGHAGRRPDVVDRLGGEQGGVEIGPEPGDEEHHLGSDEQHHAVAQPDLDDRRVVSVEGRFADHVPPPADHRRGDADEADGHQPPALVVHVHHRADGERQGEGRADRRPYGRLDQMVGVLVAVMGVFGRRIRGRHDVPFAQLVPVRAGPAPAASAVRSPGAAKKV